MHTDERLIKEKKNTTKSDLERCRLITSGRGGFIALCFCAYEHNPGKFPVGVHFDLDQGTVTSIAHIMFIFIGISEVFNHLCVTEGLRINPPPKKIQLTVVV